MIDELIVALKLDPSNFDAEQQKALERFKKTTEAAKKHGDTLESIGRKAEETYAKARNTIMAFGAALLGASSIEQFIVNQTKQNVALGRSADLLDMNIEGLSKWQTVSRMAGGSANDMTNAMTAMTEQMVRASLTGDQTMGQFFQALHIDVSKSLQSGEEMEKVFFKIADAFKALSPQQRLFFGRMAGWDAAQISLMSRGSDELHKMVTRAGELYPITQKDVDASRQLAQAWNEAAAAAEGLGRKIATMLTPEMVAILHDITQLLLGKKIEHGITPGQAGGGGFSGIGSSDSWLGRMLGVKPTFSQRFGSWPGGAGTATSASSSMPIAIKPGAGLTSPTTEAILKAIAGVEGIDRATALNDAFHQGRGGLHPLGLAADVTVKAGADSEKVANDVRLALARAGISATVLNEYLHPSAGATGGHLHIGARDLAAGSAAGPSSTTRTQVSIQNLNVYSAAKDAAGISKDISDTIGRQSFAVQAQHGGM